MGSLWGKLAAGLALAWCLAAEAAPAPERLPADPRILRGTLPNGMTYAILPHDGQKGALSFRLTLDVGSVDETDAERGAAHFVEHMAFRATRNFPEGELERAFAASGVAAGRDQNAFTGPRSTLYVLDLPNGAGGSRDLAMRWLRDVADGVAFDPGPVERERGVVLAERDVRAEPNQMVMNAITAFQSPELRSTQRAPIGDLAVLRGLTPAALQAFYARWYRPEHARLTIVGDVAAMKGLVGEVIETFGAWQAPSGPPPIRAPLQPPDAGRGLDATVIGEQRVDPGLSICRLREAHPPVTDMARLQRQMLHLAALTALQTRLDQLSLADPAVLSADVDVEDAGGEYRKVCVVVGSAPSNWQAALRAVQMELRRFTETGPGEDEIEAALIEIRGGLLGEITDAASRSTSEAADRLAFDDAAGDVSMEPREQMRAVNKALAGWTRQDVHAAWREDWAGSGPSIAAVGFPTATREQVLTAWTENATAPLGVYAQRETPLWAYGAATPGKVVSRSQNEAFVRLRFDNGVLLNFKQTSFAKGLVEVRVDLGGGRRELGARSVWEGRSAAGFFVLGGLGRHAYADLEAMFGDEVMRVGFTMENRTFTFASRSYRDRLPAQLLVMSTYLLDPGFRGDQDGKLPALLAADERASRASPLDVVYEGLEALAGARMPKAAALSQLTSRDFDAWLRPVVTGSPIEVTLVGDIDEADAIDLVAKSFGALPPRAARPAFPDGAFGRFPKNPPERVALTHSGPPDKAVVALVWPLFVAEPARRREQRSLRLLGALFDDELRSSVREQLGKAYAPLVEVSAPERADQAYLIAAVETAPSDAPLIEAEIRKLAGRLAAGEIDPERLEAARKPLVTQNLGLRTDNAWWAQARQVGREDILDVASGAGPLADLTEHDVRAAAAAWLSPDPIVFIATPEAPK